MNRLVSGIVIALLLVVAAYQVLSAPITVKQVEAYQLVVDEEPWFTLENKDDLEEMLSEYQALYMPEIANELEVDKVGFLQDVQIIEVLVNPEELIVLEAARDKLYTEIAEATYIEVKAGDTLSALASSNGTTMAEIERLNPELQPHRIFPGDKIVISPFKPSLDVVVVYQETRVENIPFGTTQQNDSNLLRGQRQVVTRGVNGEREVTYNVRVINGLTEEKAVLQEKILKEPVSQVVRVGTKQTVSRGGSVNFGVVSGSRVTSAFGWRTHPVSGQRSHHAGVDIGAPHGAVVYAYSQGTVSFAGWNGGYGNVIYINHGNGMQTRYAHLSRMDVRVGQSVSAGQAIGRVGSTGTATGPHLHFEVRINGEPRNPLNYL